LICGDPHYGPAPRPPPEPNRRGISTKSGEDPHYGVASQWGADEVFIPDLGEVDVQQLYRAMDVLLVSRDSVLSGLRDIQIPALSRCVAG
jgi:hypothetical protein